jgi:exosortase A-associated hydrolase 2
VGLDVISTPYFIDGPTGKLFAVHHAPQQTDRTTGHVLVAPPFNEEMNRCRAMLTMLARGLSEIGLGLLVLDPSGTGDSHGEHVDARWSDWLADLEAGRRWLDAQPGGCRAVLGIRLGAILAAQLAAESDTADKRLALALWQPVIDGKSHLTQFFRVRIAAQMDRTDLPKETTASMRAQLAAGQPTEVAGYELHPELTRAIDAAALANHRPTAGTPLLWLENALDAEGAITPASRQFLAHWPGPDVAAAVCTFSGPAFWQVHERMLAPDAIVRTLDWCRSWVGAAPAARMPTPQGLVG